MENKKNLTLYSVKLKGFSNFQPEYDRSINYVITNSIDKSYKIVREWLDNKDYGFNYERESDIIEIIAVDNDKGGSVIYHKLFIDNDLSEKNLKVYYVKLKGFRERKINYVLTDSYDKAYKIVREWFDINDYGFNRERELDSVEIVAEEKEYTVYYNLYIDKDLIERK
jgi:hypothetical protein